MRLSTMIGATALAGLLAFLPGASPETGALAAQKELSIQDQPGSVPTPEEERLPAQYRPQPVYFRSNEPPGTIVIHTSERFLYLVQDGGRAIRYGVGVGRDGFHWQGLLKVSRKQEWPDWRPPPEMIQRQPYLPRFMAGGPGNPMGARALYLGDTGCFRLVNRDVIDLFGRVPVGTKVVVRQAAQL